MATPWPRAGTFSLVLLLIACQQPVNADHSTGVRILWQTPLGLPAHTAGWGNMPATDGTRVFAEAGRDVVAFDVADGRRLWQTPVGGYVGDMVVRQGGVYFPRAGDVLALDAATGAVRWRFVPDSSAQLSGSSADDRAYYIGTSRRVYALSLADGRPLWSTDVGPEWQYRGIIRGVSYSGDTVYVGAEQYLAPNGYLSAGWVVALAKADGHILWRYRLQRTGMVGNVFLRDNVSSAPTVAGNLVVATNLHGNSFFALDRFATGPDGPPVVWRVDGTPGFFGPNAPAVVRGDIVYVGSNDVSVYAVDRTSGRILWRTPTGASINGFTVCGETAFASEQGVYALDRHSGAVLKQFSTEDPTDFPTSGFAVTGDRVFVIGTTAMYAFSCG